MNPLGCINSLSLLLGTTLALLVSACGGDASTKQTAAATANSKTVYAEMAVGASTGTATMGDVGAGVTLLPGSGRRSLWERVAEMASPVRTAYAAASLSCTTPTATVSGTAVDYLPAGCTGTLEDGTAVGIAWSGGPWRLATTGCTPTSAAPALIGTGCLAGSSFTRTAVTLITRSIAVGALNIAITQDTSSASGYLAVNLGGGATVTCVTACPAANDTVKTRRIDIVGTHIVGNISGLTVWDQTVYTTTGITVDGAGPNRVITGGTVVTEHNVVRVTTSTTFNGPLAHTATCAFPVSGSVTTTVIDGGGALFGKSETLSFTGTCGAATITYLDGTTGQTDLRNSM